MRKLVAFVGVLLICSTAPAAAQAAALVGNQNVAPTATATRSGRAQAFEFTASATGAGSRESVYVDGVTNAAAKVTLGLYANSSGGPGTLLASGSTSASGSGWTTVSLSGATITSGRTYWLAILGSGGQLGYRESFGGCTHVQSSTKRLSALPRSWSGSSGSSACASVYVSGGSATSNVTPPRNTTLPTINGTPQQGATLTATQGAWSGTAPLRYGYQWSDGATGSTDTLAAKDVGQSVSVKVTATNSAGSTSAISASVGPVKAKPSTPGAPSNTALPTITGASQVGNTLTASSGSWSGDTPMNYSYKWSDGKTGQRDTLPASDQGQNLTVTVTATNDAGSASATSKSVGPVQSVASPPPSPAGFQSVTYWLAWVGGDPATIPWNAVTQADVFSLATCVSAGDPSPDCTGPSAIDTQFNGVSNANVAGLVNAAHQHGRRAIITIGGSTNANWAYPCSSGNVAAFAQNLVNYMRANGFDGVDLDIEQDTPTGNPTFTAADLQACAQDVYKDAKAVRTAAGNVPLVTSDVDPTTDFDIGKIEEPYVDQFNAMSYGATGSQLSQWITNLEHNSGIPASKITVGSDLTGNHDCAGASSYAANNGLAGTMVWYGQAPQASSCFSQVAPFVQ